MRAPSLRGRQRDPARTGPRLAQALDQERHIVRHEPADEMDVAAKAVEFCDGYVAPPFPCSCQRRLQLGPAIDRIRTLAGLHLNELAVDLKPLCLGEVVQGNPLCLNTQARSALLRGRNRMYVMIVLSVTTMRLRNCVG